MGFWAWFTGAKTAEKALGSFDNLTNKVAGGLDQLFFTDQEKAQVSLEGMQLFYSFIKATQEESSIRAVTRRIIAWLIIGSFIMLLLACAFLWRFDPEWANWIFGLMKMEYELVLLVAFFYFGYFAVSSIVQKAKQ